MSEEKQAKKTLLNRRQFLIVLGTGGAVALGVKLGMPLLHRGIATMMEVASVPFGMDAEPSIWFEIRPDNRVALYIPKVEMGQGIHTALGQIGAEELEVRWEDLQVEQAGTGIGLDDSMGTSGSSSVSSLYQPLREAGALMREMLLQEAAVQTGVSPDQLVAADGVFSGAGVQLTYGEVVANKTGEWKIPKDIPPLKPTRDFKFIGQSMPRVDLLDKVQGKAVYGYDMQVDGMLYGAILRPPTLTSTLRSINNLAEVEAEPGVVAVVYEGDFCGVVAETREQAYAGIQLLDAEWDAGELWQQEDIEAMVTVGKGKEVVIQKEGSLGAAFDDQSHLIEAEYRSPIGYHAHLEPQAAVADVRADGISVWASTQTSVGMRTAVAKSIDRKKDEITVMPVYLGGGFGRKIDDAAPVEAARLSAAIGKPVYIGWTRTEDFLHGFVRPPTHSRFKAKLDAKGFIEAIEHQQASGEVAFPFMPEFVGTIMGADFAAWRGSYLHYAAGFKQTTTYLADLPFSTGWWRGLGVLANVFALESFIDELAHSAGMDPMEFRMLNRPEGEFGERVKTVLQEVVTLSDWYTRSEGVGKGIAWSTDVNTVVAEVAEVRVVNGEIVVDRMYAAVDPGLVISPNGAEAQTIGAITMGLSAVLKEEVTLSDSQFEQTNFHNYPLLKMTEAPEIVVKMINSGDKPFGMGEPPIAPVGSAVANAVFDLTGQRIRTLPLKL